VIVKGYCIRDSKIYCSDGTITEKPYGEYLIGLNYNELHIMHQLSYDVACLLKAINMPEQECKTLFYDNEVNYNGVNFKYIHNKMFQVKFEDRYVYFADASQYLKNTEDELHKDPMELAIIAGKVGQEVNDILENIGIHAKTLMSPIRAYEKYILSKVNLPLDEDYNEDVGDYAYECCKHNWVEAMQIGHWNKTWDYDISSAYPSALANLVDFRLGTFKNTNKYEQDAYYGFYKCRLHINHNIKVSPIMYIIQKSKQDISRFTPTGYHEETFITKHEIDFINKWKLGEVEVIDGKWLDLPQSKIIYPLRPYITKLYEQKELNTGFTREIIKRIPNGIYGKLLETNKDGLGNMFNAVWGCMTEVPIRLKVAELALINNIVPIHVAVDGLLSDRELKMPENNIGIGSWKLESIAPAMCIGSGTCSIKGRDKSGDFSLDYDWLLNEMITYPYKESYSMSKQSPITLAVACHDNCFDKLGTLRTITKSVDIMYENKRSYNNRPKNGGEFLKTQLQGNPYDISFIMLADILNEKEEV
jgi:hypothetical protein